MSSRSLSCPFVRLPLLTALGCILVLLLPQGAEAAKAVKDVSSPSPSSSPSTSPSPTPTTSASPIATAALWRPVVGGSWQIQFSGVVDLSVAASTFDVDGFDTSASTVASLHAVGRRAICYVNAGSWEDWRSDAGSYPASVLGASNGWPGERWVDIRQVSVLKPILDRRLQMCRDKGFDAVDPDNVDGYANQSGFALTASDQLVFNRWLAAEVHAFGMSVGLKNDLAQVSDLARVLQ